MTIEEEILLAEACSKGIRSAQQFLYKSYAKVLYSILFRYLLDTEESRDMAHDCFLKIFDKIHLYKGQGSLEGWMKRVAVNHCLSVLRTKNRIRFTEFSGHNEIEQDIEDDGLETYPQHLSKEDILRCLNDLPADYKIVFQLYALDEFSHKEIGQQLGIKENASRARYFRAKKMIKEKLMTVAGKENG
ncbi:MAG: sigma-70 family RNA polymerase sigma factor [Opitutaceae bacterium]|nr:sigma-70 family RNA polymerase sigma factor [Cytophagales bacterium]